MRAALGGEVAITHKQREEILTESRTRRNRPEHQDKRQASAKRAISFGNRMVPPAKGFRHKAKVMAFSFRKGAVV